MKMWPWMQLGALLTLILGVSIEATEITSKVSHIQMESVPGWTVQNGQNLTLNCIVDISTTSQVKPEHTMLFYRNNKIFHSVTSTKDTESIFIPQASIHDSGIYRCAGFVDDSEMDSDVYVLTVKGMPSTQVTLDKKEVTEGDEVAVTCAVKERAPIYFTIEKFEVDTNLVKQKTQKLSQRGNVVTIKFPIEEEDHDLIFRCQATVITLYDIGTSEFTKTELVTVKAKEIPKEMSMEMSSSGDKEPREGV